MPKNNTDTLRDREIAIEQRHLDRVYARVEHLRAQAAQAERDGYRLAQVGNLGALVERDAIVRHAARRRAALDAQHEGLVFGRLDRQGGTVEYVGRLGVRDADGSSLVVDWRAPAAADFYQATAADPRGVVRRRMIRSSREVVTGLEDDLLDPGSDLPVIGDGALLASLSRATGAGMKDIVATIQAEQDAAIRAPATGVTVIEGGPGTGKTAVALHRVAYLLYRDRARYAGGALVVGPSAVFVRYIATVLPSLGEENATLRSLGDLIDGASATRTDPPELAGVKGSLRMCRVLRRAAREQVPGAPTELRLAWHGTLLRLTAGTLEQVRRKALAGRRGRLARRNEVRRVGFDAIFDVLWQEVEARAPSYHRPRAAFEDEISDRTDFRDFLRAWWPLLRPVDVLAWLADPDRLARLAGEDLTPAEATALAGSFGQITGAGPTVADVALLDELEHLLGHPPRPHRRRPHCEPRQLGTGHEATRLGPDGRPMTTSAARRGRDDGEPELAHVVVDESQDVSPMQWRMLGRRGRHASWTVVGDPAQTAWTGDPAELARARSAALRGPLHPYSLTTNYRNSVEIFDEAAAVIRRVSPDLRLPTAVRTTGVPPEHRRVADLPVAVPAVVTGLLEQVEGTVGVITPIGRREQVAGWLDPDPRVQVVTALEAKGMEYDGVVVVEPAEIGAQPAGTSTLYVALSRATQRLVTVTAGTR
jgi:hypothetical protein